MLSLDRADLGSTDRKFNDSMGSQDVTAKDNGWRVRGKKPVDQ